MSDNNLRKPPRTRAQYVGDSASRALAVVALATIWSIAMAANDIGVGPVSPRPGALIPPVPPYGWRLEKAVMIPMRDGVHLATDLYMPVGVKPPFPVIFIKPGGYGKHFYRPAAEDRQIHGDAIDKDGEPEHADRPYFQRFGQDHNTATWFASHGYVVAIQDARGRFESEGTYTLVKDYKNDIYDTVDWLAKQPWSSQKVGMMGCSYGGEVQLYQAAHSHPALKAIIPQAGGTSVGSAGGFYSLAHIADSGILALGALAPWYQGNLLGPFQQFPRPPGITDAQWHALVPLLHVMKRPQVDWNAVYRTLPEIDIMAAAGLEPAGLELTDWRLFVPRFGDVTNAWWQQFDFVKEGDSISTPALFMDAWYDRGGIGFSDGGISGFRAGHSRRNEVHEEAQT
jgi:putative CocE/NonD family hydrolase